MRFSFVFVKLKDIERQKKVSMLAEKAVNTPDEMQTTQSMTLITIFKHKLENHFLEYDVVYTFVCK